MQLKPKVIRGHGYAAKPPRSAAMDLRQLIITGQTSAKVGADDTCVSYRSTRSKATCARSPQVPEHFLLLTTLVRDVEHHPLGKPLETLEGYVAPNRMLLERS
jgi:hypothetical protein